jgi:hypothetical protein
MHLPKHICIFPEGTVSDDPSSEIYDPNKTKQEGVSCPACDLTWTSTSHFESVKDKDDNTNYKVKILMCLAAENRKKENRCINCPVCKNDESLMESCIHICVDDVQNTFTNPGMICKKCNLFKPPILCDCKVCNVAKHSIKQRLEFETW